MDSPSAGCSAATNIIPQLSKAVTIVIPLLRVMPGMAFKILTPNVSFFRLETGTSYEDTKDDKRSGGQAT